MAASNRSGLGSGSLLRGLVRLALFLGLGFGAGLIFGIVTEEPQLLAGHLQGETESHTLAAKENESGPDLTAEAETEIKVDSDAKARVLVTPPRGKPAVDDLALAQPLARKHLQARQEEGKAPRRLVTIEAAKSERMALQDRPRLPLVAAPAPATAALAAAPAALQDAWAIQVGAFSDRSTAEGLVQSLAQKRYRAEMIPADSGNEKWRVRIQPVTGRSKAEAVAERLKRNERLPTWLIPFEARERP